jgi:hypothetical protein
VSFYHQYLVAPMQAEHDPVNELGDDFAGLDARAKRETDIKTKKPDQQGLLNKYLQERF